MESLLSSTGYRKRREKNQERERAVLFERERERKRAVLEREREKERKRERKKHFPFSHMQSSLKREKVAGVGATPGFTKVKQEIHLDKKIRLLDCPGIVFSSRETTGLETKNIVFSLASFSLFLFFYSF